MAKTDEDPGPMARLVKRLRAACGWTQEELAGKSGLERVEVSNLETGRNKGKSARVVDGLRAAFQIKPERWAEMLAAEDGRSTRRKPLGGSTGRRGPTTAPPLGREKKEPER